MHESIAVQFIELHAAPLELARLDFLLHGQPASAAVVAEFQAAQRADGGFSPLWAEDYSSLDATCFRLAQAQQLGIPFDVPVIATTRRFMAGRQKEAGSWEEDALVAAQAPHWAKPGELPARLYLTANCAYWLAASPQYAPESKRSAAYLLSHQEQNGHLPSFLHAHWLAAGAWLRLRMEQPAMLALDYLQGRFDELCASHLAWLVTTLVPAGLPTDHRLISQALAKLGKMQQSDGRWQSEDGADFDVNATLDALFAFKLCGMRNTLEPDHSEIDGLANSIRADLVESGESL